MGVRAENKKYYREKILRAAKEVFSAQGFEDTTIEQIAEKAGIGLGTTYNYFKSKEELFVFSMAEDIAESTDVSLGQMELQEGDAAAIVINAILPQIKKLKLVNKKIMKIAFPMMLNAMKSDKMPLKEVFKADYMMMDKIGELLEQLKTKNMLEPEFDTATAVDLMFGSLFFQLTVYIYSEDMSFEQACEKIAAGIRFVLDGK